VVLFPCCTDETFLEILCHSLGPYLDGLIFDMEHYSYSAREIERAVRVCEKHEVASLVRPLDHSESSFKAALSTGTTGLFVNDTRSVEEFEHTNDSAFFPKIADFVRDDLWSTERTCKTALG
jgi:2-keto-3-deoxy-L-rhamnonate aldolase RhmA